MASRAAIMNEMDKTRATGKGVSRRVFVLFLACAVLPLLFAAFLLDRYADRYFETRAAEEMRLSSNLFSRDISDCILLMESELRGVMAEVDGAKVPPESVLRAHLAAYVNTLFSGLGLDDGNGVVWAGRGPSAGGSGGSERRSMRPGQICLSLLENEEGRAQLIISGKSSRGTVFGVAAESPLQERALADSTAAGAEVAVTTASGLMLVTSGTDERLPGSSGDGQVREDTFNLVGVRDGREYVGVASPVFLENRYGCEDWFVYVLKPRTVALGPLRVFRQTFALFLLISVGGMCLLGVWQVRRYTRHLSSLYDAVRRIEDRDYDFRLDVPGDGELGKLAKALNTMGASLRGYEQELESQAASLRESEHRYRRLVELGPDAVTVVQDGRCLFANAAFTRVLGYDPDELEEELAFESLVQGELTVGILPELDNRPAEGAAAGPLRAAPNLLAKDGTVVPCETSAVAVQFGGKPAVLVSIRNVSERRQMEQRLRQTEKMQAVGQLAGGVAHDFNNQLSGIMGYAELLIRQLGDRKHVGFARKILTAAERARDLTAQLLAFSRRGKYQSVPVDLHVVVEKVIEQVSHDMDPGIHIERRLKASPSVTTGDPTQLENALLNLAVNARDAMPAGGKLAFVTKVVMLDEAFCRRHASEAKPGRFIAVSVRDTGAGMATAVRARVFEPFFTVKSVGEGTGMELAAVYGTAATHKGVVTVNSSIGEGSTFTLYLPLAEEAPELAPVDETAPAAPFTERGKGRIMVVDDEMAVREVAWDILVDEGYSVVLCENGTEAASCYREHWQNIDLVILDMVMPDLNGRDTFLALRRINPDIQAILSSGYNMAGEAHALLKMGFKGFVQKPYRPHQLTNTIDSILADRVPPQRAAAPAIHAEAR